MEYRKSEPLVLQPDQTHNLIQHIARLKALYALARDNGDRVNMAHYNAAMEEAVWLLTIIGMTDNGHTMLAAAANHVAGEMIVSDEFVALAANWPFAKEEE